MYDFAIIGAGAAGLHLALAMQDDDFFRDKSILILEKESKDTNDRTWSFWETGKGKWDKLIAHEWRGGKMYTPNKEITLDLGPYRYKMLRSLDFYSYAKEKIEAAHNFHWKKEEVKNVSEIENAVIISGEEANYQASQVFDSRISPDFFKQQDNYTRIQQHFKGWFIKTEENVFDPEVFTIMDFRLTYKGTTSFSYVLPSSPKKALVEFTFFSPTLVEGSVYDEMLQMYLGTILRPGKYEIEETEYGVIPMSDYPFHKANTRQITKIGTAGSWVKPSSGYSFKNAERFSQHLIHNIKKGKTPAKGIPSRKFRYYDTLFLHILNNKNELGPELFCSMYENNTACQIFRFLDEETSLREDLNIISGFDSSPFLKAMVKTIFR